MPARKPKALITRHETAAEAADRLQAEEAMQPGGDLPMHPPSALKGMKVAGAVWRRLMRLYGEIEGTIATRLDMDLLVNYCISSDQLLEMDRMRRTAITVHDQLEEARKTAIKKGDFIEALSLAKGVTSAFDAIVKIDARADQKRKAIFAMQQSLYLTPRARAAVAPKEKEKDEPKDVMEELLNDIKTGALTDDLNEGKGEGG